MKESLDSMYLQRTPSNHLVLVWLPRHAAATVTMYGIGKDGRTAYERWKCKKFRKDVAEFGETCGTSRPDPDDPREWLEDGDRGSGWASGRSQVRQ